MGFVNHNAIVVTTWDANRMSSALAAAIQFNLPVVGPVESTVNRYFSFLVGPDGSNSGWEDDRRGDGRRADFRAWLRAQAYEDGSSPFEWCEVAFGSDPCDAKVVHHQWDNITSVESVAPKAPPAEPADLVVARSLYEQLDGDPDVDELTGGWLPYAARALLDLQVAGWRIVRA